MNDDTTTITIEKEVQIDEYHAGMLDDLREEFDEETIDGDLIEAAVNEDQLLDAIYAGHRRLQSEQK